MARRVERVARLVAFLAAVGCLGLWVTFLWFNPYRAAYGPASRLVGYLMIVVWLAGLVALHREKFLWALLVFAVAFFPVGLYLLGTPGLFLWIGVLTLVYLAATLLWHRSRRSRGTDRGS